MAVHRLCKNGTPFLFECENFCCDYRPAQIRMTSAMARQRREDRPMETPEAAPFDPQTPRLEREAPWTPETPSLPASSDLHQPAPNDLFNRLADA